MVETTELKKYRQKKLRSVAKDIAEKEKAGSYFYPKTSLYTKEEFELLDSIYSDGPPGALKTEQDKSQDIENFWVNENTLNSKERINNYFKGTTWFIAGILLSSFIWFIYFQFNVYEIKTKHDTQIVFQQSPQVITDKTADKELSKKLEGTAVKAEGKKDSPLSNFFKKKKENSKQLLVQPQTVQIPLRQHIISSGDSIWVIANKYYSNPSYANMNKLLKANNLKSTSILTVGRKLVIPN